MADEEGPQAPPALQGAHDPLAPQVPPALEALHLPAPHVPLLNWSHFKPEYSGKPDEDIEAHLLRTNDWMDTHGFQDNVKVQRFCLTPTGQPRL